MVVQVLHSPEEKLFEDQRGMPGGIGTIYAKWTSATGGGFTQALPHISGRVVEIITNPGTDAPTQDYNVTLISRECGHDILEGCGADRHTTSTETTLVLKEATLNQTTFAAAPYMDEAGAVLTIDSAGDVKSGEVWIFIE